MSDKIKKFNSFLVLKHLVIFFLNSMDGIFASIFFAKIINKDQI